jgi:hypothetical protein
MAFILMPSVCRSVRSLLLIALFIAGLLAAGPSATFATDLQPETAQAYERYVRAAQARMAHEDKLPERFLYIESLPQTEQRAIWATLRRGDVWLDPLDATDENGKTISAPHGTITHWVGAVFFPGASLQQVVGVVQDFDHLQEIYQPEIVRSRLISQNGETFHIFLRIHKDTAWVNPTFDVDSTVTFRQFDSSHAQNHVASTRIVQIENAGKPDEHADSVGHDSGYLWRLNTYWRLEARDGGVVGEWEAITLSRSIPFLLRWLVRPFVERLARQTVRDELLATRKAVERRVHGVKHEQ